MSKYVFKTALGMVILSAFALQPKAARADLVVSVGKVEAASGKEVTVPISFKGVKDVKGVSCMSTLLTVDPKLLTFKKVDKGPALTSAAVDKNVDDADSPGVIALSFYCNTKTEDDGVIINVVFAVNENAAVGDKSLLKLSQYRVMDTGEPPQELPVRIEDGEFTVSAGGLAWWLWAAIAGAAVVVLLLLAALFRRSAEPAPAATPSPTTAGGEPPTFSPESPTFPYMCVKCGGVIQLPRAMAGQSFKCGGCGTVQIAKP
jgi:hypothetical protein